MKILLSLIVILISSFLPGNWKELAPGLEYRVLSVTLPKYDYPIVINAVRLDPQKWELVFRGISREKDGEMKTTREWCSNYNLTAAINAGMYNDDYRTHTGYLRDGDHVNSRSGNSYKSLFAFNPEPGHKVPPARIFDLDQPGVKIDSVLKDYSTVIQNLRLIKRPGVNVWNQRKELWSEAALAEDKQGRIIFLFSETPVSMYDFNQILLKSDLEIVAAQHLDGNAPAQFYLKTGTTEIILSGDPGFEVPIPSIIGVRPKTQK
ncbi:MAG: phosphodiester glycosidase family protein [Bacteroidales bacterium]|nr:phosphodiester glycosidase family protein [Bacteroidales bacterium]